MTKTVTHIPCPKEWEGEDAYSSHRPLLWLMLKNNKECHPIAEFGSGYGSTPLLREYCKSHGAKFETWDTDKDWANLTGAVYISSFKDLDLLIGYIIFIDGKPGEERKDLIERYKYNHLIIAHDTEETSDFAYGMKDILSTFEYRLNYAPEGMPHTTIVSKTINVCDFV